MTGLREVLAALLVLGYLVLCAAVLWRQRRRLQAQRQEAAALATSTQGGAPLWVLYASMTGQAEALARQAAQTLHGAGHAVHLAALGEVDEQALQQMRQVLIVAATAGQGDAPDNASAFVRRCMGASAARALPQLRYGLLALGDRSYPRFCGFGRALDAWLQRQGAQPLFDTLEVDRGDSQALSAWHQQLSQQFGTPAWPGPEDLVLEAPFEPWQLVAQRRLNPEAKAEGLFHVELKPLAQNAWPQWQAGDLVQVLPGCGQTADAALRPREYTVASLPAEGRLQLLVRQTRRPDGSLGLVSGQLTDAAQCAAPVLLRLRPHANFRIGANAQRPLILIGNGSGLAGLLAHLKARAAQVEQGQKPAPAWLLYGEREAAHDSHYLSQLTQWQQQGWLQHVQRVFSRDGAALRHVQEALALAQQRLRDWVAEGAALYVCGSVHGMAAGVDAVLREALGAARVDELIEQGRYRRDVY
ncbi:sulfite reductase subunit alpha [Roseateles sp. BYS180W]|uniref:NADPH--hemoprotein reductase n=1 Tax=Roseateles rivi TaxID=3299028 RepID=A0ABW7FSZ5_9BURK